MNAKMICSCSLRLTGGRDTLLPGSGFDTADTAPALLYARLPDLVPYRCGTDARHGEPSRQKHQSAQPVSRQGVGRTLNDSSRAAVEVSHRPAEGRPVGLRKVPADVQRVTEAL